MKPEIIGKKYNKVAKWWHEHHHNSSYGMKQIERAILYCNNHQKALDVGCGSGGRIITRLLESGFKVKGIDVSEKMLELAKVNHPDVEFELVDACKWESKEEYDLIVAWDSIFHVQMSDQEAVIAKLCNHLKTEGVLIYTFGDDYGDKEDYSFMDENDKQAGELHNDKFGYGTIGINGNLRVISNNGCKCMHLEIDQYPANHVYVIAKKICGIV